ncbi:MAG: tetratricopeptide repeat protein [Bacteroidaceae bacterium]|nr:tetratricopeptide repeat protein [Bacteroidaceae bacterium]
MKKVLLLVATVMMSVSISFAQTNDKEAAKAAKAAAKALKAEIKAANKVLKEAQGILNVPESGSLSTANDLIQQAMVNVHTKDNPDTWNVAGQIQNGFYIKEAEKLYLGQPYDTVAFFGSLSKMCDYFIKCDELEQELLATAGKAVKYRPANKEQIQVNRPNLLNGGIFYYNKGQFKEAHSLFSQYIATATAPMLAEYNITPATDEYLADVAAYYSVQAGLQAEDYELALTNIDLAKQAQDPAMAASIYRLEASSYLNLGDSAKWIDLLKAGVERAPEDQYYYSNLISYFVDNKKNDELMAFADEMVARNPQPIFRYVKGYLYQNMKEYDKAIEEYKLVIEQDPTYASAYHNLGICYSDLAQQASEASANMNFRSKEFKAAQEKMKEYYRLALPMFEKLRTLDDGTDPERRTAWTSGLYNCYYILNMGKELAEIEKLLNQY